MNFADILLPAAAQAGFALSPRQREQFTRYYELLIQWNEKMNLTAITQPQEVALKHMVDSLTAYDAAVFADIPAVIDVGTGAGFPGVPLKIFLPELSLTLMDSLNKRLLFLQEVVDQLELSGVRIVHARAEDAGRDRQHRGKYGVALSRAVARLNVLCELCLPLLQNGGYFVAMKGAQYREELQEADRALTLLGGKVEKVVPVELPGLEDKRAVIYVRKVRSTPADYPRRAGLPEKKPL
ncbi:MAG TPA: 16S rRNA (guanine(527)-N(7))-methyltransferase RsmG [Patescibacteria group bacterium]|nr:16S rRNA (guanine(527)-N(7))-methyltransferase RsmG [Patescibacteria group bacterium]